MLCRVRQRMLNKVTLSAMTLEFPNPSRCFDETQRRIQFWAHDGALEISFFVETDALRRMNPSARHNEDGFLATFDVNRGRIERAAKKAYARYSRASYTLAASNF